MLALAIMLLIAASVCLAEDKVDVERMKAHVEFCADKFKTPVQSTIKQVVLCRDAKDLAAKTFCPVQAGVVARASLHHSAIFITRPSRADFYHEAAHVIFQSNDERLADKFMRFCLNAKGAERE